MVRNKKRHTNREKQSHPKVTNDPILLLDKIWLEYAYTMPQRDCGTFLRQLVRYGFYHAEPEELNAEQMEYFNKEIRDNLDKQYIRIEEERAIYNNTKRRAKYE